MSLASSEVTTIFEPNRLAQPLFCQTLQRRNAAATRFDIFKRKADSSISCGHKYFWGPVKISKKNPLYPAPPITAHISLERSCVAPLVGLRRTLPLPLARGAVTAAPLPAALVRAGETKPDRAGALGTGPLPAACPCQAGGLGCWKGRGHLPTGLRDTQQLPLVPSLVETGESPGLLLTPHNRQLVSPDGLTGTLCHHRAECTIPLRELWPQPRALASLRGPLHPGELSQARPSI